MPPSSHPHFFFVSLKRLTCLLFVSACDSVVISAHFLSGGVDKIKLNDPPRRDLVIMVVEKKKRKKRIHKDNEEHAGVRDSSKIKL